MPTWDEFKQFLARDYTRHALLGAGLIFSFVLTGLGAGWYAKGEALYWLCQYDTGTDQKCGEILNAPSGSSNNFNSNSSNSRQANSSGPTNAAANSSPTNTNSNIPPKDTTKPANDSQTTGTTNGGNTQPEKPLTADQLDRLHKQAQKIRGLIAHHAHVMSFFFQAYYSAISVVLFAGAFVAVALFFIAKNGWTPANQYVKTIFIVSATAAAFYGLWPPVFQQEKNISDNKSLFLEYEALADEIDSYPITRTNVKNEHKAGDEFITYIDSELARLGNIAIGFDYTKITYKGAFETKTENPTTQTNKPTNANKKSNANENK